MVNAQRTQEEERGQTRVLLKGNSPMPRGADGKALPGLCCPTARELTPTALGKHLHRPSLHVCSPLDTCECSPWRHDTQLPAQQVTAQVEGARSPKAAQLAASQCSERQEPGLEARKTARMLWWSCCRQCPPTPATRCSSSTGNRRSRPGR